MTTDAPKPGLIKIGLAAAIAFAILAGLGTWQLLRLKEKETLIARVAERMAEPPVAAPAMAEWPSLDLANWTYRRVTLMGTYDFAKEARVYINLSEPRGKLKGPGYFILTPLRLSQGGTVIVNRGFTPQAGGGVARGDANADVTVTGPLREPEGRNMFTPSDEAYQRLFFARDPKAIAADLGIPDAAPFTVDAEASGPGGLPQGGETRLSFPNRHMEYALTWYGLAATLAAFFAVFAWRTRRGGEDRL
ncbi:SURF1 family cytochrome oxidase biogenesis protein [Methylopila sp. M107]|uniref:SURF1 family protein n=1 Tax=Methylopila sp. M107 TaxID=1101190 RepID=UPI00037EAAB8|nr:SURF1 family cytochrome oxidase biogenesis protein [Methylopila sp. M107]